MSSDSKKLPFTSFFFSFPLLFNSFNFFSKMSFPFFTFLDFNFELSFFPFLRFNVTSKSIKTKKIEKGTFNVTVCACDQMLLGWQLIKIIAWRIFRLQQLKKFKVQDLRSFSVIFDNFSLSVADVDKLLLLSVPVLLSLSLIFFIDTNVYVF